MRIYISGKIGKENAGKATLEKFARRERFLLSKGHEVFNPTKSGLGKRAEQEVECLARQGIQVSWYSEILLLDLYELRRCDAIYMLPDWQKSPGAMVEFMYAGAIGMKIFEETDKGIRIWRRQ